MRAVLAVGLLAVSAYGAATKVPEGVEVLRDLEYAQAKGVSLKLDLYRPSAKPSAPMPLVIWVHGGGWRNGSKANCPAAWLATKGYAVASLDFRLLPEHPWPAQIEDPIAALRWLRQESGKYGFDAERWNRLHPESEKRTSHVERCLSGRNGPAIAATDYVRAFADQIRAFVPMHYTVLGTDGFGRSDTRSNLRRFFEVDRYYIAHAAIAALAAEGKMNAKDVARAIKTYNINPKKANPIGV